MTHVCFVLNDLGYFISHRLLIARSLIDLGYTVTVVYGDIGKGNITIPQEYGISCYHLNSKRSNLNPFLFLFHSFKLSLLLRKLNVDITHAVTLKYCILTCVSSFFYHTNHSVFAVSGLGSVFLSKSIKARFLQRIIKVIFSFHLSRVNSKFIVQNINDKDFISSYLSFSSDSIYLIRGNGIDFIKYKPRPIKNNTISFAYIGRYIRDKGYLDFISAANYFKSSNRFKFLSYGDIDLANPSSLSSNEINFLMNNSNVDIFDYQSDLDLLYSSVDVVIIPSYREGLPRVLIEASSFGKAIIASDAPGCSECVHDGYNGYIFSVGNILDLVYTINLIASDISILNTMKVNSTKIASRYFLIDNIVSDYLRVYNEL